MNILHLEDERGDAMLVAHALRDGGTSATIQWVVDEAGYESALARGRPDVILSDYLLAGFDGLAALKMAQILAPGVPFIFVSGALGEEKAVQLLRRGATDYILKDRLSRLPNAIHRAVTEAARQSQLREADARLQRLSRLPEENPAPVLRLEGGTKLEYANPIARRLFAAWCDSELGVPAAITQLARQTLATGQPVTQEIALANQTYAMTFAPMPAENYVNLYGFDVTARRQAEQALLQLQNELEAQIEVRTVALRESLLALETELSRREQQHLAVLAAIERERAQLGRELHEDVAQQLTGLALLLNDLPGRTAAAPEKFDRLQELVAQCLNQTRHLALGFYPIDLDHLGLLAALQELAARAQSRHPSLRCAVTGTERAESGLPAESKIQLFRIAQEALQSAVSANATELRFELDGQAGECTLTMHEIGGTQVGAPEPVEALIPSNLRHRAEMIHATLVVTQEPTGRTLRCRVPLPVPTAGLPAPHPAESPGPTGPSS